MVFSSFFDGCAVPIGIDLYICLESTPITSPSNFCANLIARLVLPDEVGPDIANTLSKTNQSIKIK